MFRLLRLEQQVARWLPDSSGSVTVTYALIDRETSFPGARNCGSMKPAEEALGRQGLSRADLGVAMRTAARKWERVTNIRFVETHDVERAGLLIGAQTAPVGRAFTNVELTPPDPAGTVRSIARALICMNPEHRWKIGFDGDLEAYDLGYTLAHELGHAIGLDHPGASGQLMGFRYTEKFSDLQPGDVAGAVALYGRPASPRRQAHIEPRDGDHPQIPSDRGAGRNSSLAIGRATP